MGWMEKALKVCRERGYLVISRNEPCRLGVIITSVNVDKLNMPLPQPFQVVSETDLADYAAQHEVANEALGDIGDLRYFYRIMTD